MNRTDLYRSLQGLDDDLLERSETAFANSSSRIHRRLSAVLLAAILAVFFIGASAAAVLYGDSIQNWFYHRWKSLTGQSMSTEHAVLIDHLSQEIGLSQTVDGVTVTVDSAAVGDDSFFLLLRVQGMEFSARYSYGFDSFNLNVMPDPLETSGGLGGFGAEFQGLDDDGSALILFSYDYTTGQGYQEDLRPLELTLTLTDFLRSPFQDRQNLLVEGTWNFSFTLARHKPESIRLPDSEVAGSGRVSDRGSEISVLLTELEVTNTGIRFQFDCQNGEIDLDSHIFAILENGQEIGISSGNGTVLDSGLLFSTYTWLVPIPLEEVTAVRIGGVEIPCHHT